MKKIICVILAGLMLLMCGCARTVKNDTEEPSVAKVKQTAKAADGKIDIDLTKMSSTMVYSEVSNIVTAPEKYVGKVIKMSGPFQISEDDAGEKIYFNCIISDATACCQSGLEFATTEDFKYPEDFPEVGETVTVVGTFETYSEGDQLYCHLKDATLL